MKKKVKLTEGQLYKVIEKMMLEYIGDNGMLGKEYLDTDEPVEFNHQPSNALVGDEDNNEHDAMGAGEEDIDPSYYEDPDIYANEDMHDPTDNELYNGNW